MSETMEESYNKSVDNYEALEEAIINVCDIKMQNEIFQRKKELLRG